jgi:hypothetical protein
MPKIGRNSPRARQWLGYLVGMGGHYNRDMGRDDYGASRSSPACFVCEGETELEEDADTFADRKPPCPDCHAPTERIDILERRRVANQP